MKFGSVSLFVKNFLVYEDAYSLLLSLFKILQSLQVEIFGDVPMQITDRLYT